MSKEFVTVVDVDGIEFVVNFTDISYCTIDENFKFTIKSITLDDSEVNILNILNDYVVFAIEDAVQLSITNGTHVKVDYE